MRRLILFLLLLFSLSASAQFGNLRYAEQFSGSTQGAKVTAAQGSCSSDTALPCVIVLTPVLSAYAEGTMPARPAHVVWLDFRTPGGIGVVGVASVMDCSSFAGSNASAKIIACLAAIPTGGIADARKLPATGTISASVVIGENQILLLGNAVFTISAYPAFTLNDDGAKLIGLGAGESAGPTGGMTVLRASGAAATDDMILIRNSGGGIVWRPEVSGLKVDFNNASGAGRDGIRIGHSRFGLLRDIEVFNAGRDGLRLQSTAGGAIYRWVVDRVRTHTSVGSGLRLEADAEITHNLFLNCEFDAGGVAAGDHQVYLRVPAGSAAAQSISHNTFVNLQSAVGGVGKDSFFVEKVSGSGQVRALTILGAQLERNGGSGGTGFRVATDSAVDIHGLNLLSVSFAGVATSHNLSPAVATGFFVNDSSADAYKISQLQLGPISGTQNEISFASLGSGTYGLHTDASGGIIGRRVDTATNIFRVTDTVIQPTANNTIALGGLSLRWSNLRTQILSVFSGVAADSGGIKPSRTTTGSCATTGCTVTVTWGTAFGDTNYTPLCTVEDATAQSETTGLRLAKILTKTASALTVAVDNFSGAGVTGTLHCVALHD